MCRRSAGDDRGQILLLTALSMVALLAVSSLALDASYMYDKRNRLHASADAAAKSGAIEVRRNPSVTNGELQTFGNEQVTAHGFDPSTTTSVVINRPPATGPYAGNAGYVEAIVSEPTATFLGGILGMLSMTPGARAVAGTSSGPDCIITLAPPTATPESFTLGNSVLNMPGCSVANAGDMDTTNPNSEINAAGTGVTGGCLGNGCAGIDNMTTGAPSPTDPLAGLPAPANPGGCAPAPAPVGGVMNLPVNACYSRIDVPNSASTLNFVGSGLVYVTGAITIGENTLVNGTGIMIYLAGTASTGPCTAAATAGCINVGNGAEFHLSAQTSGPYNGILFFQDPANQLNAEFDGNNPIYDLSGAMYFPNADVSFRNGMNATNDCMLFVARSLLINNGNGSFSNVCSSYGGSPIMTVSLAE
jgi:Flp pilus assembly protein TadG